MVKTVSLDDMTHAQLVAFAGRLTMMVRKPVPLGFAAQVAVGVAEKRFNQMSEEGMEKIKVTLREIDFRGLEAGLEEFYKEMMRGAGK